MVSMLGMGICQVEEIAFFQSKNAKRAGDGHQYARIDPKIEINNAIVQVRILRIRRAAR